MEELVVYALFSTRVAPEEKRAMAEALVETPQSKDFHLGRPDFPIISEDTTLASLIGPESWTVFHTLHLDQAQVTGE